jgi:hypothetical protein
MGGSGFSGISANFYPWLHVHLCSKDVDEVDKAKIQRFLSVAEVHTAAAARVLPRAHSPPLICPALIHLPCSAPHSFTSLALPRAQVVVCDAYPKSAKAYAFITLPPCLVICFAAFDDSCSRTAYTRCCFRYLALHDEFPITEHTRVLPAALVATTLHLQQCAYHWQFLVCSSWSRGYYC